MPVQYVIGIDLGTTNSVLAYAEAPTRPGETAAVELLPIPQLVAAGTVEARASLPSFAYLASDVETGDGAVDLPWGKSDQVVVGQYAQTRGAEAPQRTVVAAKSWLCQPTFDRRAPILPFQAPDDVDQISPVEATRRYLQHLVSAWNHRFPNAPFAEQSVVLTVPASFDPIARELTRGAAVAAGLPADFVLLEEPQAALYAWLDQQGEGWRQTLSVGNAILVCDVGGGTTDLTLIRVDEEDGNLVLHREAVGDHLLVGGDNMDLAAAHAVAQKFAAQGTQLNPWQSVALWHSCRRAKETLLDADGPSTQSISVLGRSSKLIGGTISVELDRQEISDLLLDGFFPACSRDDAPQRRAASGFQEIGLPFESDPAITRHIAGFVQRALPQGVPRFVLFNGGVFKASGFQDRLLSVIQSWSPSSDQQPVSVLHGHQDLDHAVARGACFYGCSKRTGGIRIRGGVAHSYYVGIESAGLAIPGAPRPLKALCVVPQGMEEGAEIDVPSSEIGLLIGHPVQFRFFRSNGRPDDQPGMLLDPATADLNESSPLLATLDRETIDEDYAAVKFRSRITELGMFELWCTDARHDQQWKLEFNVREEGA